MQFFGILAARPANNFKRNDLFCNKFCLLKQSFGAILFFNIILLSSKFGLIFSCGCTFQMGGKSRLNWLLVIDSPPEVIKEEMIKVKFIIKALFFCLSWILQQIPLITYVGMLLFDLKKGPTWYCSSVLIQGKCLTAVVSIRASSLAGSENLPIKMEKIFLACFWPYLLVTWGIL